MHIILGGNILAYYGPVSTPPLEFTTVKLHWNSFLSKPDKKYLIVYVKNFQLNNPTNKKEYYSIEISLITQEIIYKYDLANKHIYCYVYVRM